MSNDHLLHTSNSSTMAVDLSSSGVPLAPVLPPTLGATSGSGRQTLRVHETAINYSLLRSTSGADNSPETGNRIPTSKRPRPEADDDTGSRYKPRDPVCNIRNWIVFVINCVKTCRVKWLGLWLVIDRLWVRLLSVTLSHNDSLCILGSTIFGPTLWNTLPPIMYDPSLTLTQFCSLVKTMLFYRAYETLP